MGSFNINTASFKEHSKSPKVSKSKGDRLGWVSVKNARNVDLKVVLSNGQVAKFKTNRAPLLVP